MSSFWGGLLLRDKDASSLGILLFLICAGIAYILRKLPNGRNGSKCSFPWLFAFPTRIPIIQGIYIMYRFRRDGVKVLSEWSQKLSTPVFQFYGGPFHMVGSSDALYCHKILSSSNPGHLSKPQEIYSYLFPDLLRLGLVNADYGIWSSHRKVLAKAFGYNCLQGYLDIMNKHCKNLIFQKLLPLCSKEEDGEFCVKGKEMYEAFNVCVIGTILEFILGSCRNMDKETAELGKNFRMFRDTNAFRLLRLWLRPNFMWWLHPKSGEQKRAVKAVHEFVMKVMNRQADSRSMVQNATQVDADMVYDPDQKQENRNINLKIESEKQCLIEFMLANGFSHEEIYYEVGTFLAAFVPSSKEKGHETTEATITSLLFDLALNPICQDLCREEVDQVYESKQMNSSSSLNISMDDQGQLKYLERCIMECLRLTPTIPIVLRRMDKELVLDEKYTFEEGEIVMIPIWVIHRNPKYYTNPEKFDPDRFLPEEIKKRGPGTFIPFTGGPRLCIGRKFAMMHLKTLMLWVLRYFTIHTTEKRSNINMHFVLTVKPDRDYNIILKRRDFS